MKLIEFFVYISKFFPDFPLKSSSALEIRKLFPKASDKKYSSSAFFFSFVFFLIFIVLFGSILVPLIIFSFIFYFVLLLPKFEIALIDKQMESELPFFLRESGMLIDVGLEFSSALSMASQNKRVLSSKFETIVNEAKESSFQKALLNSSKETNSNKFKRALSVLLSVYESGDSRPLLSLSDELMLMNRHEIRDASSKLSMFSMFFIVFSALAPTFFLIYFAVGRLVFSSQISESDFSFGMLIVFPFISVVILLFSRSFFNDYKKSLSKFDLNPISFYLSNKKKEEIDKLLPDALMTIAASPSGASADSIFSSVVKAKHGEVSREFEISLRQLRSNISLEKVLFDLKKRNDSQMLDLAADTLYQLFSMNKLQYAAKLAEDFLSELEIRRERASIFSMQKYTLFFGAVLVPIILSFATSLSSEIGQMTGTYFDILYLVLISQIYLVIYCLLVSYFVSIMENRLSFFIVYMVALSALSLITFNALNFFLQG